uniref:Uncharacterized protein n=1 Tax=Haemonchus contortus TaxID=6289 RepID=A0A7I5E785_HAECO
MVANGTN